MPNITLSRISGGAAIAVAAAAVSLAALPATASAAVQTDPPDVFATTTGTSITMQVTNANSWSLNVPWCQAFVVNGAEVAAVLDDPTHLFDDGVVVYPTARVPLTMFGVAPGSTVINTVENLAPGVYGVIGGCIRLFDPFDPVVGNPQIMQVGLDPVGSSDGSSAIELPFGSSGS